MNIVRESLYEKYIGSIKGYRKIVDIHINPINLNGIGAWSRCVTDLKGNMYIGDGGADEILHGEMIRWLIDEGYMSGYYYNDYQTSWGYKNCVCWQRLNDTNQLWLSESYDWEKLKDYIEDIKKMSQSVIERYPGIEFIFERLRY